MSTGLSSSLNWVTFKSEDVQKAREILKELGPDSTVDSIGLGLPFEEISNIFFPATSTLHTRLRYQLFVPAIIYKMYFEANQKPLRNPEKRLYELEVALMKALLENDEGGGVIGRVAKEGLKYWPSQTYWGAVNTMRILSKKNVSKGEIFTDFTKSKHLRIVNDDGEVEEQDRKVIDPDSEFRNIALKMFKNDTFVSTVDFNITEEEARFLIKKLEEIELGKDTLLYQWSKLSISKIEQIQGFMTCPPTGHEKLDNLIQEAKNYSYIAMGISHAYRYALCAHRATLVKGERRTEWEQFAQNNIKNLDKWIKKHKQLKTWKIEHLDSAIRSFASSSKVDKHLTEMVAKFCELWKKSKNAEALAKAFVPEAKRQEEFRRRNRSHFLDPHMTIPENSKGETYRDWLFNYRFAQGYANAKDLITALRRRK